MGSSQMSGESEGNHAADVERRSRRNRLLVIVGLVCFVVGVPLVSLPDGTALSVIGLSLETVAGACVITFIYLLAGEEHEPDDEENAREGYRHEPDDDEEDRSGGGHLDFDIGEDGLAGGRHEPEREGAEENDER